jgi:hypothetical protein
MVGPMSTEERDALTLRLKVAIVALVGLSSGLITLLGDPSLLEVALVVLVGLGVGVLLVWIVFPGSGGVDRERGPR